MSEFNNESFVVDAPSYGTNGLAIASFVCGIVGFACNPCYLVVLAAIICGIIALVGKNPNQRIFAIIGTILGGVAMLWQILFDILTLGAGIFF